MTGEQKEIVRRIIAIGKRRGASKAQIKAALETGAVESNFRNLNHGDADSKGWRQERQSLYKNPTNLNASINRFYDEVKGMRGKSGEIAARAQRPAAQYRGRYAQHSKEAENLLRGATGSNRSSAPEARTTPTGDRRALLLQYVQNRHDPNALLSLAQGIKDNTAPSKPTRTKKKAKATSSGDRVNLAVFRLKKTSGYRTPAHNAAVGGVPNSAHTRKDKKGRPAAEDFVGSEKDMQKGARSAKRRGARQVLIHDAGSGRHLHVEW